LYEGIPTHAGELAGLLNLSFEEARADLVRNLSSHADLVDYATRSGHRTRPVGCLLAADAVGGDWRAALDAAVAVELIHKSSVIRDDIVDGDLARSGQPALHVAFDTSRAIATSDLLWTLALQRLSLSPVDLQSCAARAMHEMATGQLEDVAPSPGKQSVAQRRLVEERKTGVLSELACRLGAVIGGGTPPQVEALSRYGRNLGTAFQILNDVRNLRGEETERRPASDLRNRRSTILSAYAREVADDRGRALLDSFVAGSGELPEGEVEALRETILSSGAAEFGERTAAELMEGARLQLDALEGSTAKEILESLTQDALLTYAF
jgi:geranylgeranyl pyrophosphate synthase